MSDEFMGAQRRQRIPSMTLALLILNVAAYIAYEWIVAHTDIPLDAYFPLSRQGLQHGYLWQLLTYQFMHAPLEHGLTLEALRHFEIPWHLL
jgi:membrane associated rhomboid family serine protease